MMNYAALQLAFIDFLAAAVPSHDGFVVGLRSCSVDGQHGWPRQSSTVLG